MVISGCSKGSLFLRARNCLAICWINSDGSGGIAQFAMFISLRCLVSDNRLCMFKCIPKFPSVICHPCPMSPLSYICFPGSYVTRVLFSQGAMSPRIKCPTDSMFPMLYVPSCHMFAHVLCSIVYDVPRVLCSLLSYVPLILCSTSHIFPVFYAIFQDAMSPLIKCSTDYMFQESYVPRVLCIFPGCYVPVFNVPLIICSP